MEGVERFLNSIRNHSKMEVNYHSNYLESGAGQFLNRVLYTLKFKNFYFLTFRKILTATTRLVVKLFNRKFKF